jgi:drug/metabolite transporter (DMT)-like permease
MRAMPLTALGLVLLAALLHALWNIAAKKAGGGTHFAVLSCCLIVVLWAPLGLVLAWHAVPGWGWLEWGLVLASALANLGYFQALLRGYRAADLTVVYPIARGTAPLLSVMAAVVLLGETLSALGVAAVLAITLGIVLIAGGPALWRLRAGARGGADSATAAAHQTRVRAGLCWGALTGALTALYTVTDSYAVKVLGMSPMLVIYLGNVLRLPLLLPVSLRDRAGFVRDARAQWKAALMLAVFGPVAYLLVLYAVMMAPLSHVAPAREASMLFAALLGGRLLGEADRGKRLWGAACLAFGVVALAVG